LHCFVIIASIAVVVIVAIIAVVLTTRTVSVAFTTNAIMPAATPLANASLCACSSTIATSIGCEAAVIKIC
jgi:hypothetical protein